MQERPLLLLHLCQEAGQQVPHLQVTTLLPLLLLLLLNILLLAPNSCSFPSCRTGTSWTRCLSLERLGTSLVEEGRIQVEQEEQEEGEEGAGGEQEGAGGGQIIVEESINWFWRVVEGDGSSSDGELDEDSSDAEELDEEDSSEEDELDVWVTGPRRPPRGSQSE